MFWRIKNRIKTIWRWLPIIWNDYDWDERYIFIVLLHKLKTTYHCLINGNADWTVPEQKEYLDALEEAIKICQRLVEDEYYKQDGLESQNQDIEKLFDIMKEYIRCWWD